jgi:hypothetical protein
LALNIINFSNGIRPEEIQNNFEYLQEQISRERVNVGGSGIASGLEITVNVTADTFQIELSDGSIIDDEGQEVFIKGQAIDINPPILYQCKEYLTLSEEKTISFKHTPYALSRRAPVEQLLSYEPEHSGIRINYRNSMNVDDYIRVRNILGKTAVVAGSISKDLEVTYYYTAKRIDTLYLDEDLKIKVKEGTTSTTPSAILPTDAKYLIAYLEINNEYKDEKDPSPHAYIYVKNDLKTIRNLYTTKDGQLYICGIPFDELQIVHLQEPTEPKEHALWLNLTDNTLYCWRATDEFVYKNKIDISTDFINNVDAELIFSTYMDFVPGSGELKVYLNDVQLMIGRDYEEINNTLPTYAGNRGDSESSNTFRILQTLERADGFEDVLIPGDVLMYTISYKDSQYTWVPLNKQSYITAKSTKVYCTHYEDMNDKYLYGDKAYFDSAVANKLGINPVSNYPNKYQYFIFDRVEDIDMHFTPNRKELSVMINQMYLHEDQFREITVFDFIEKNLPDEILAAATDFGWSTDYLEKHFNGSYDRTGIGFMLTDPLDAGSKAEIINDWREYTGSNDLFVEAIVEHRVCNAPLNRKLERSATFIYEDSFEAPNNFNNVVTFDRAKYRFDEHQLEVFLNGVKQNLGIDYIEQFGYLKENTKEISTDDIKYPPIDDDPNYTGDQNYFIRKKSAVCTKFKFLKNVSEGSIVSYKITTNVYSYDHINNILDNIGDALRDCNTTVKDFTNSMNEFKDDVYDRLDRTEEKVNSYIADENLHKYLTSDSILTLSQMPPVIVKNAIKSLSHINRSVKLLQGQDNYTLQDIWPEDYLNIFCHVLIENESGDEEYDICLVNGLHYSINSVGNSSCYLQLKDELKKKLKYGTHITNTLYISGIKLSSNRTIS